MEAWKYLVSVDGDTREEERPFARLGDTVGEGICEALDRLTAQLLMDGIRSSTFNMLEGLWMELHGSSATGRLLDYVVANDDKMDYRGWRVPSTTPQIIKEITAG